MLNIVYVKYSILFHGVSSNLGMSMKNRISVGQFQQIVKRFFPDDSIRKSVRHTSDHIFSTLLPIQVATGES